MAVYHDLVQATACLPDPPSDPQDSGSPRTAGSWWLSLRSAADSRGEVSVGLVFFFGWEGTIDCTARF